MNNKRFVYINYKIKSKNGVAFTEFVIIAPVLIFLLLAMIDLFTYLYLANVLEGRAYRALEVATWVPGLEDRTVSSSGTSPADQAKTRIANKAFQSEISNLFSSGRANLSSLSEDFYEYPPTQTDGFFSGLENHKMIIALPFATGTSREEVFSNQPIGVRINAKIKPITPFMPEIDVYGEAWGYRETHLTGITDPMFDCNGNPFDPNNPPAPGDCSCVVGGVPTGMNPATGLCGCPPEKPVYDFNPTKPPGSPKECICDLAAMGCSDKQLIDYVNCTCGDFCRYPNKIISEERMENNTCGCKFQDQYIPNPTAGCGIPDPATGYVDLSACSNANCVPPGEDNDPMTWQWRPDFCGCTHCSWWGVVLQRGGDFFLSGTRIDQSGATTIHTPIDPSQTRGNCEDVCSEVYDIPGNPQNRLGMFETGCACDDGTGNPMPQISPGGKGILNVQTCAYECDPTKMGIEFFNPEHIGMHGGACTCAPSTVKVYWGGTLKGCCDPATAVNMNSSGACDPATQDFFIEDAASCSTGRCCLCRCKSGYLPRSDGLGCIAEVLCMGEANAACPR